MPTQKPTISARVDPAIAERIEKIAAIDRRKPSQVIEILIERAIEDYEDELLIAKAAADRRRAEQRKLTPAQRKRAAAAAAGPRRLAVQPSADKAPPKP